MLNCIPIKSKMGGKFPTNNFLGVPDPERALHVLIPINSELRIRDFFLFFALKIFLNDFDNFCITWYHTLPKNLKVRTHSTSYETFF